MILFRNAVKQISRRQGYHATFMCGRSFPNAMSSGWTYTSPWFIVTVDRTHLPPCESEDYRPSAANFSLDSWLRRRRYGVHDPHHQWLTSVIGQITGPDRIAWGEDNRGANASRLARGPAAATRIEIGSASLSQPLSLSRIASDHGLSVLYRSARRRLPWTCLMKRG